MPRKKGTLSRLKGMSRPKKRAVMVLADLLLIAVAIFFAVLLKHDRLLPIEPQHIAIYVGTVVVTVLLFIKLGLYRAVTRYIGPRALRTVFTGVVASATVLYLLGRVAGNPVLDLGLVTIYGLIAFIWVGGSRLLAKWAMNRGGESGEVTAIYGAGEAGIRLARALDLGRGISVAAFLDDKQGLQGSEIDGIPVRSPDELPSLIKREDISRVLLAVPAASRRRRAEIIQQVEEHGLLVQTVPDLAEIASGHARVDDLRPIDVGDLLGRDPVPPNMKLLDACIRGKSVMVTGAGGSIGSELCRQILRLGPARLVLFEVSELALYSIEAELRLAIQGGMGPTVELVPLLGNAHHRDRALEIITTYAVQTVYHAAAYKHVPIVECNVIEGVHNNVISTWNMAEAALEGGVETFVLISTDKAVNPTNVMGATKRFAEMVLQGMNERGGATRFCMVRFGNVLESSGSVVPLFREQIRRGGPVTVTHREMIRYFMTIPEASQLVLQAGSMAKGGDVFVLDMGKPMRIDDLARRMVRLSGLTIKNDEDPDGDIEISYTGLRPAEKLYEELLIGNNVSGTDHPMIMRAMEHFLPWSATQRQLQQLLLALSSFDVKVTREILLDTVVEYRPHVDVVDLVWQQGRHTGEPDLGSPRDKDGKVTDLRTRRGINSTT